MISLLIGKIINVNILDITVLTPGGVGYKVFVKPNSIADYKIGEQVEINTYLSVSETAMNLFGFGSESERELFLHLINVSGIGPKSGLHLLSLGTVGEISNAISNGDVEYLTKVSGVGKKTAERVVVELKNKVGALNSGADKHGLNNNLSGSLGDVVEGLIAMGYSPSQARETAKSLDSKNKSSEELLREALQTIK
jgi:holliday junction DNA helicase RuvA